MSEAAAQLPGRSRIPLAVPRADACSVLWDNAHASALGTAPSATFWVALEQDGPWGARAATQSHLDPGLGGALDRMCSSAGGRLILIRRPAAHWQRRGRPQRVYLAGGLGSRPWLLEADLTGLGGLAQLNRMPLTTFAGADIGAVRDTLPGFSPSPAPVLLICTNSKRDLCCAVRGRHVALQASSRRPGRVWECSHTGGHRFAPTGVLLPHGQAFGRLTGGSAVAAVDAATSGQLPKQLLDAVHDRGRSHLSAAGQAAESTVRHEIQEASLLALGTTAAPHPDQENTWQCRVSHVDGRRWDLLAVRTPGGESLPQSCGMPPGPTWQWSVVSGSGQ
jgi:hypothetical protein